MGKFFRNKILLYKGNDNNKEFLSPFLSWRRRTRLYIYNELVHKAESSKSLFATIFLPSKYFPLIGYLPVKRKSSSDFSLEFFPPRKGPDSVLKEHYFLCHPEKNIPLSF